MNSNTQNQSAYRRWRLAALSEGPQAERDLLGSREVETFGILVGLFNGNDDLLRQAGLRILDLGCGDEHLRNAAERVGWLYRGIDVDECNLDSDPIPEDDDSVELVVSLAVLEHLSNPVHFLTEIKRVLRPGGVVIISTPNWRYCVRSFWNDPTHVKPYTVKSLGVVAEMSGLNRAVVYPGLRCKPPSRYQGRTAFWRARWLLPFRGDQRWAPGFLRGRSTSLFLIATKRQETDVL